MKMYTTSEQTAKLIELGFEKPKNTQYIQRAKARNLHSPFIEFGEPEFEGSYSIGELIEMLDNIPNNNWDFTRTSERIIRVEVHILPKTKKDKYFYRVSYRKELIDALYDMILRLKEEGVI